MADYLARIAVLIGADSTELRSEMTRSVREVEAKGAQIESRAKKIGVAVGASLAAAAAGLGVAINGAIDRADAINEVAEKLGVGAGRLSELGFAAEQSNSSVEGLGKGLLRLSRTLGEANSGNEKSASLFRALGIEITNADGSVRNSLDVFGDLADRIAGIEDPAKQTAIAVKLLGKGGSELVPLLRGGSAGLAELAQQARDTGAALTDEGGKAADAFNDSLKRAGLQAQALGVTLLNEAGPALLSLAEGAESAVKFLREGFGAAAEFVTENIDGITAAAIVGASVLASQYAAVGAAAAISASRALAAALASGVARIIEYTNFMGAASAANTAFGASTVASRASLLSFVGGPLGAAVLGVGALTAAIYYFSSGASDADVAVSTLAASTTELNSAEGAGISIALNAAAATREVARASLEAAQAKLAQLEAGEKERQFSAPGGLIGNAASSVAGAAIGTAIDTQREAVQKLRDALSELDKSTASAKERMAEYTQGLSETGVNLDALIGQQGQLTEAQEAGARAAEEAAQRMSDGFAAAAVDIDKANVEIREQSKAIADLRRQMNPFLQTAEEYRDALVNIAEQQRLGLITAEEAAEMQAFLAQRYQQTTAQIRAQLAPAAALIATIKRETSDLRLLLAARKQSQAEYNIEREVLTQINNLKRQGIEVTQEQADAIREEVREQEDLLRALEDIGRESPGLIGALSDALTEAFKGDAAEAAEGFFARIKRDIKDSKDGLAGLVAEGLQSAASVVNAYRNSNGNGTGSALREINSQLAASGNPFAAAAAAIDSIFGGRLFGTDYQQVRSGFDISGFSGQQSVTEQRQRSFFRGTATRTTRSALDDSQQSFLDDLKREVTSRNAQIARAFGSTVVDTITGSFSQVTDKNGKIIKQISTVLGVAYNEGVEDWANRVRAENIIASVDRILGNTAAAVGVAIGEQLVEGAARGVEGSGPPRVGLPKALEAVAGEASAIAQRWRSDASTLLDGAQFLLAAATDIRGGLALLGVDGTLTDIADLIEELNIAGEPLAATYARVSGGFRLLDSVISGLGITLDQSREEFVRFSAGVVEALGGLDAAGSIIARNVGAYLTEAEQQQIRATNAQNRVDLAGARAGITGNLAPEEFGALLRRALAGEFTPERTAAILQYGAALADFNDIIAEGASAPVLTVVDMKPFEDAVSGVRAALDDFGQTDYQRQLAAARANLAQTQQSLYRLGAEASRTDEALAASGDALQLFVLQQNDLLQGLQRTVLRSLIDLYGNNAKPTRAFTSELDLFTNGMRDASTQTANWAEELERLERLDAATTLARNLRDLFEDGGRGVAAGLAEFAVPVRSLLEDLGVSFADITSPASVAAFGRAARLLGLTAEELAALSGVDISGLSQSQRDQINAGATDQADPQAPVVGGLAKVAEAANETTNEVEMLRFSIERLMGQLITETRNANTPTLLATVSPFAAAGVAP